jgi:hypothetical protein
MKLYRTQIVLKKSQYDKLAQIAQEESRSLSEVVGEIVDRQLRYRKCRQMLLAARELWEDYNTNPDLNEFNSLDRNDFI